MNIKEISTWKEFKIGEVVERITIKSLNNSKDKFEEGTVNVISNSAVNNGVIKKIKIEDEKYIHNGNALSYGAKGGKFFYQKERWVSNDHVHMFISKYLNENNSLFLCSIINKVIEYKGGWSSSLESNIVNEKIKLPITENGSPDWQYMEDYILLLKSKERIRIINLFKN